MLGGISEEIDSQSLLTYISLPKFFPPVGKYWKCVAHCKCYHQENQKSSHLNRGSTNQHFDRDIVVVIKLHKGFGLRRLLGLLQL